MPSLWAATLEWVCAMEALGFPARSALGRGEAVLLAAQGNLVLTDTPAWLQEPLVGLKGRLKAVISCFDKGQCSQLTQFVTSQKALPLIRVRADGGQLRGMTVQCDVQASLQQLPVASTCTTTLVLPCYTTWEILREKLLQAISHTEDGFHLV